MNVIKIIKEPIATRWYTGKVGVTVEHVPRYDDQTLFGVRDLEGYINFVSRDDGIIEESSGAKNGN
jgi:hypothetical protein